MPQTEEHSALASLSNPLSYTSHVSVLFLDDASKPLHQALVIRLEAPRHCVMAHTHRLEGCYAGIPIALYDLGARHGEPTPLMAFGRTKEERAIIGQHDRRDNDWIALSLADAARCMGLPYRPDTDSTPYDFAPDGTAVRMLFPSEVSTNEFLRFFAQALDTLERRLDLAREVAHRRRRIP